MQGGLSSATVCPPSSCPVLPAAPSTAKEGAVHWSTVEGLPGNSGCREEGPTAGKTMTESRQQEAALSAPRCPACFRALCSRSAWEPPCRCAALFITRPRSQKQQEPWAWGGSGKGRTEDSEAVAGVGAHLSKRTFLTKHCEHHPRAVKTNSPFQGKAASQAGSPTLVTCSFDPTPTFSRLYLALDLPLGRVLHISVTALVYSP